MNHLEKKTARRYDTPGRCRAFTDTVYKSDNAVYAQLTEIEMSYAPETPCFKAYIGDMHGHTELSDGCGDIDSYFTNLRKRGLDFAAISDHDHGGVGQPALWEGSPSKWDLIQQKVNEYDEPHKFTTILAYERDSYPFYNNLIVYYGSKNGQMIRGAHDGEFTAAELLAALKRDDVLLVPHDTYYFSAGADLAHIPKELFTPLIEVYSCGDAAEYMYHPAFAEDSACDGGFWQDALRRGAKMGCIAGSDNHNGTGACILDRPYPFKYQGLTGIWAEENTLDSLFSALKARRCYAFMGGHMVLDFRINGHYMGEEITAGENDTLTVWFSVQADAPVKQVTLVKNQRDYIFFRHTEKQVIFDYNRETPCDCYYLRAELDDGRFGWTSPIWVSIS